MLEELLRNRGFVPLVAYAALLLVAVGELVLERRRIEHLARRWVNNLGIGFLSRAILRLVMPIGSFALAQWCAREGVGALHIAATPPWLAFAVTLVGLDLVGYWVHRLEHVAPPLWRLHRVHHTDTELDFSTSQRQHPLGVLFGSALRLGVVVALGAAPAGLVAYFLLRGPIDAFAHGNLALSDRLDRGFRWLVITPGMHAVHHSAAREETDANFGTLLSVWDRLFGTYRDAPAAGYRDMTVGIESFRTTRDLDVDRMLLQPFRREIA